MTTTAKTFAKRDTYRAGCTDPEMLRKSAEHFRKASYELISYEMERQHAPTSTTEPLR